MSIVERLRATAKDRCDLPNLAADETERLRALLHRALAVAETGHWRDKSNLSLEAHPLWDDIRAALEREP